MNVTEAIQNRRSIRAFLPKPIEKEKLDVVLAAASRTPSWANTQPWEIFVVTGETLERIREGYRQKYADKATAEPETPRPAEWSVAAKKRIEHLRPDMARVCGDAVEQFAAPNQAMFNAPAVVYVCMDKVLSEWSLYDIGAYPDNLKVTIGIAVGYADNGNGINKFISARWLRVTISQVGQHLPQ